MAESSLKFTPQVNAGNIITLVVLIGTLAAQWGMYSTRQAGAESRLEKAEKRQDESDKSLQTIKESQIRMEEQQKANVLESARQRILLEQINDKLKK